MISLRFAVEPFPIDEPLIVRLKDRITESASPHDAMLMEVVGNRWEYDFNGFSLVLTADGDEDLDGDVILILPGQASAHRLVRSKSDHNTFLITERCDQLCVMCSQPPKKHHTDLFEQFTLAACLAPPGAMLGISGGKPLLFKKQLFRMIESVGTERPDVRFHILTNGQHFEPSDVPFLRAVGMDRILWGVPLYSSSADQHDPIVGKVGAFDGLRKGLGILMQANASVELRTVILKQNVDGLEKLANYVVTRLGFISVWALMQLERIGYGRMNWSTSFVDTSLRFGPVATAIDIATARGLDVSLYNFPLCSLPSEYRSLAPSTISDWKRKYLDFCDGCAVRSTCGGFFEWYNHNEGFGGLGPV